VPGFTIESADLQGLGPVVEISFSLPQAVIDTLPDGASQPAPVKASAMVDTGDTGTCVQQGLLAPLGLQPTGVVPIVTPTTTQQHTCPVYFARLTMPKGLWLEIPIVEAPLQGQPIQALLGRDVLRHGHLIYSGTDQRFTVNF
jgi:hypothetical protein